MSQNIGKKAVTRTVGQTLVGAAVGAGGAMIFFALIDDTDLDLADPSRVLAIVAGLIYAISGLFVAIGASAPRLGARFLNVEDADELREQRRLLAESSVGCVLVGLVLLVLAIAGPDGIVSREAAAVVVALSIATIFAMSVRSMSRFDELMRRISIEASAFTLHASLVLLGGWAALAHLEYVPWIGPLAWISALALLELLAIFWVSGKRGLLKQR
ncbi:MAG: hypothetical protein M3438_08085 [Pseudomonadota bacterium]|nr:hypothetical protein [Sphingomonas sp.]MDQ3479099.1 hypothetical protein [Pseudomonadota bacterium]